MSSVSQLPLKCYNFLQTAHVRAHTHTHTHTCTHFCLHLWILNICIVVAMVDLLLCQESDIYSDIGPTYCSEQHVIHGKSHSGCTVLIPVLNSWKQEHRVSFQFKQHLPVWSLVQCYKFTPNQFYYNNTLAVQLENYKRLERTPVTYSTTTQVTQCHWLQ